MIPKVIFPKVILILGPMYSGKTSEAHRLARRHIIAGRKVAVVTHKSDVRNGISNCSLSHDNAQMPALACENLSELNTAGSMGRSPLISQASVLIIEEAQFFTDLYDFVSNLSARREHLTELEYVIIAGLDGDTSRQPFGDVTRCVALADQVTKLLAVCACGAEAPFTKRLDGGSARQEVGGHDIYRPVCRSCW